MRGSARVPALLLYVASELGVELDHALRGRQELGFPMATAAATISALWLGLMIGRFLNSRLALRRSSRQLVLWSGVIGVISVLALLTARTPIALYLWLLVVGLSMSGMNSSKIDRRCQQPLPSSDGVGDRFPGPGRGRLARCCRNR